MSATASRRPPWQNPRRLRQVATGAAVLLLLYLLLVFIAFLGGPRIGASFLPLPGGGPDPASPVAGLEPGQPTQNIPAIPRGTTTTPPTPGATPTGITATASPLPQATTPGAITTARPGDPATPCPTTTSPDRTNPQIAESYDPTIPSATQTPPRTTPSAPPTTTKPSTPSDPPPTSTTPSTPPTTPDDPEPPDQPSLGGLLGTLLSKLGL